KVTAQIIRREFVSIAIDELKVGNRDAGFRAARKSIEHLLEKIRRHRVVGRCDVDKIAGSEGESAIERSVESFAGDLVQLKSRVPSGNGLEIFPRSVVGSAIKHDHFPARKCLIDNGTNARLEKFARVERRHENRNGGHARYDSYRRAASNSSSAAIRPFAKSAPVNRRARSFPRRTSSSRFVLFCKRSFNALAISRSSAGFT